GGAAARALPEGGRIPVGTGSIGEVDACRGGEVVAPPPARRLDGRGVRCLCRGGTVLLLARLGRRNARASCAAGSARAAGRRPGPDRDAHRRGAGGNGDYRLYPRPSGAVLASDR